MFNSHRLLHHSTLGSNVIKKTKKQKTRLMASDWARVLARRHLGLSSSRDWILSYLILSYRIKLTIIVRNRIGSNRERFLATEGMRGWMGGRC